MLGLGVLGRSALGLGCAPSLGCILGLNCLAPRVHCISFVNMGAGACDRGEGEGEGAPFQRLAPGYFGYV